MTNEPKAAPNTAAPKSIKRKIGDILTIALIVLLIVLILWVLSARITGKVPYLFGHSMLRILTSSMEKTIMTGDYILIRQVKPENVQVGDIISFYSDDPKLNGQINTHRVKAITTSGSGELLFTTQGDNPVTNMAPDSVPARGSKLVGKYVGTVGFMTFLGKLISSPYGFMVMILVPGLILLFVSMRYMKKVVKETEKEKKAMEEKTMEELVAIEVEKLRLADEQKAKDSVNESPSEESTSSENPEE